MLKKIRGFSLFEILVGLLMASIFSALMTQFLYSQKKAILKQSTVFERKINYHLALSLIEKSVRNAGYLGCTSAYSTKNFVALKVFERGEHAPIAIRQKNAKDSDVLYVAYAKPIAVEVKLSANDVEMERPKGWEVKSGDHLIVNDCRNNQEIVVKSVNANHIYFSKPIAHPFSKAWIMKLSAAYWYVGKTTRLDNRGEPIYALYEEPLIGNRREMVEQIPHMVIHAARFPQKNTDYQNASKIAWDKITHLRIQITDAAREVSIRNAL